MLRPLFVAGAMVCTVATAFAGDPVGTYALSGHSPGGADYAGIVTVKATKQTYSVVWSFPGANLTYTGTGVLSGNALAVYYTSGSSGGVVLYQADGDNWKGIWARADDDTLGTEVWTRR
jgi:hypothetical protein